MLMQAMHDDLLKDDTLLGTPCFHLLAILTLRHTDHHTRKHARALPHPLFAAKGLITICNAGAVAWHTGCRCRLLTKSIRSRSNLHLTAWLNRNLPSEASDVRGTKQSRTCHFQCLIMIHR
eukprot:4457322-Amphidinium_carterae.2